MENAAKALLISAGVLIAILLLSLISYLFGMMAQNAKKTYSEMEENRITEYNQQFLKYNGENNLKAEDIVTIYNLIEKCNKENQFAQKINFTGINNSYFNGEDFLSEKFLKDFIGVNNFKCMVTINSSTKVVSDIVISQ